MHPTTEICPTHGVPDCSPLLNGCSALLRPCGDVGGQGLISEHICVCQRPAGHGANPVDAQRPHACLCGSAWRENRRSGVELPDHGTMRRYKGSKKRPPCHCRDCRAAAAAKVAGQRAKQRAVI